ncbi:MAG: response regulator [Planctomycetes bacterium]|nr:response regulator [Planctomycetota bacterium]
MPSATETTSAPSRPQVHQVLLVTERSELRGVFSDGLRQLRSRGTLAEGTFVESVAALRTARSEAPPDILVIDGDFREPSALQLIQAVRKSQPRMSVVVFVDGADESIVQSLLDAGADQACSLEEVYRVEFLTTLIRTLRPRQRQSNDQGTCEALGLLQQAAVLVDLRGHIICANEPFAVWVGTLRQECVGRLVTRYLSEYSADDLARLTPGQGLSVALRRDSGTRRTAVMLCIRWDDSTDRRALIFSS